MEIKKLTKEYMIPGKKNQDKLIKKEISNQEWKDKRDHQIYARGDVTKKGNLNIRLLDRSGDFYLRITVGNRKFEEYKLFIPANIQRMCHYICNSIELDRLI
jgi:CYTH domain-containing protein